MLISFTYFLFGDSPVFLLVMQVFWLLKQIPLPENLTHSTGVGIDSSEGPGLCLELLGVTAEIPDENSGFT